MARVKRESEATYWCYECEEGWNVEGRLNADGDFEPTDDDNINCSYCGDVGEYQESRE